MSLDVLRSACDGSGGIVIVAAIAGAYWSVRIWQSATRTSERLPDGVAPGARILVALTPKIAVWRVVLWIVVAAYGAWIIVLARMLHTDDELATMLVGSIGAVIGAGVGALLVRKEWVAHEAARAANRDRRERRAGRNAAR